MAEPLVAPELVTPPLGLVALLGRPELHPALREHLRSQLRPPLESVGVGDLAEATSVLTRRKRNGPSAAPPPAPVNPLIPPVAPVGIGPAQIPAQGATEGSGSSNPSDGTDAPRRGLLRADWTRKHRERRPAVALAFLPHEEVEGDPNAWVSLTRRIDALRDAAAGAGCALALVVVGDDAPERLPEDRVAALTRQARIDRSALVSMPQPPTPDAMRAVGALCANLAKAYYVGECARHAAKTLPGRIEAAEPGFKAGIFSEFHGDWGGAWRMYKTAYDGLVAAHVAAEAAGGGGGGVRDGDAAGGAKNTAGGAEAFGPVQARFERMAVAERLHYKLCALHLTLNPGDPGMCVAQMRAHHDAFRRPPGWLPPAALPRHWSWVARQHRAFAELLSQRTPWGGSASAAAGAAAGTMPLPSPPPPNAPMTYLPGFWYHAAANATERLRRAAESVDVDEGNSGGDGAAAAVVDGKYVGTFARGDGPITDAEYLGHVNARLPSAPELVKTSIELLTKAHDHFKRTAPKDGSAGSARLFASIVARLARGYLLAGDFASSKRLFDSVAPVYRREGWDDLLGGVLMGMKDCARHAKSNSEYLEICLEIAALGGTSASDAVAAMAAAQAAMEDANGTEVTIGMGTTPRSGHSSGGDDHPLARAMHCVAGFGASHAVPGEPIELTVAVRSCLPATLPVKSVTAVFGDGLYDWTSEDAVSELPARTWRVFVVKVTPAWGHPVNVVALVLTLANGVRFRLELGDGDRESPRRGWLAPDERLPAAVNSGCNLGVHSLNLRAAPLKMSLSVNVDGPALLGDVTALPLAVVSTGDGLDDAELVLTVKEGDKAGSTRENGGIRSVEASAPGPDVVLLRAPDSQSAMQPRESIAVGNVSAGGTWRGKVYVLWRRLGPPATLVAELRGVRSGLPAESGVEANAALEMVAELSARAPFTSTHRVLSAYRTFALVLDEPTSAGTVEHASDGDVTASTVSVAAAGSILAVDSVRATKGFKGDEGAIVRNEQNGGVELGEGDEFLQLWPHWAGGDAKDALNVTWRRRGGFGPVQSVLPASRSRVPGGKVPLTVTLECPPRLHAGAPFQMEVRCRNDTSTSQALTVRVVDHAGFVYSGARSADVTVDPDGGQTHVPFTLTAVDSGETLLPDLEITAKGFGAQLRLPRESRELYVLPGERQQAATAVV